MVIPLLLLLVFGIIEFGIIYNAKIVITNAAREGARKAAVTNADTSEVRDAIAYAAASLNDTVSVMYDSPGEFDPDEFFSAPPDENKIDWFVEDSGAGNTASVYVKGRVDIIVPIIDLFTGSVITIPAKAEMRIE